MCETVRLIWTSKPIRAAVGGYGWRRADSSNAVLAEVIFKLPDMNGFAPQPNIEPYIRVHHRYPMKCFIAHLQMRPMLSYEAFCVA